MKHFFLQSILLFFCLQGFPQINEGFKIDSARLVSLKKMLPSLKDSARVDALNDFANKTIFNAGGKAQKRIDTSLFYSSIAYKEAVKLNYKKGIALAMLQLAGVESGMNQNITDEAAKEKKIREALQIGEELNNDQIRGIAYGSLAYLPSIRSDYDKFDKHVEYYKKAIEYSLKAGDTLFAAGATNWLAGDYQARGEYEKAFDYAKQALDLSKKSGTDFSISWHQFLVQFALQTMAGLYTAAGDYETAMGYIKENASYGKDNKTGWENFDGDIAGLFSTMNKYDSALVYANRLDTFAPPGLFPFRSAVFGQIHLNGTKEYDKAIAEFTRCIDTAKKYLYGGITATGGLFISVGQAYDGKKEYDKALQHAKQGFSYVQKGNNRPEMMRGYQVISTIYHHLGNSDSAYEYLLKYNTIKDSIQTKQFLLRIYNSKKEAEDAKKESRIGLLNRDNQIKKQQLKQEATLRKSLIVGLILLFLLGIFVFRNLTLKRKNALEKQQLESEKKQAELEMQALRAQMNPHFIFNCLSSINRFILKNESKIASNYLTRFSRLMRMVLNNSQKPLISLDDELEMLELYIEMERLRFKNSFDYGITFLNTVDSDNIFIPPLLLQPFCENAIWHGLMNKEGQGRLDIELSLENNILSCVIRDNGAGREKAEELKSKTAEKERSMGLRITTERLALLNREKGLHTFYEIEDLKDERENATGTKVTLKISFKQTAEEFA